MVTKSKKSKKNKKTKEKKVPKLDKIKNSIILTRKRLKKPRRKEVEMKCRKCTMCDKIKNMRKKISLRKRRESMMSSSSSYSNLMGPNNNTITMMTSKCVKCDNNNQTGRMYCRNCDMM